MILAIVGSTDLEGSDEARRIVNDVLTRYRPDRVVSGGARGVDTIAAIEARKRGIPVDERLPNEPNWERGYKPRNMQIAHDCDVLVRIAAKGSKTYGSGWTRDYADRLGKPTEEFVIDPPSRQVQAIRITARLKF